MEDQQAHSDETAEIAGTTVRAEFPRGEVEVLGEPFRWYSGYTIEVRDDLCPDTALDDLVNSALPTFPSP